MTVAIAGAPPVDIDIVRAALVPQLLFALTEMVPPVVVGVTVMEFVVEAPIHPDGNVQV